VGVEFLLQYAYNSFHYAVLHTLLSLRLFFFNATATTDIYTLSLHDALPICAGARTSPRPRTKSRRLWRATLRRRPQSGGAGGVRSEEHTSELQSRRDLVCRLLLEKKKTKTD